MNIILYSRVSTHDQSTAAQLIELRAIAGQRKWNVVAEFEDVISGATKNRPALDKLMERVRQGGIDAVAVVKIDRLGRSLQNFLALVTDMKARGCSIICTSQGIDTTSENPCGTLMANMLASFAQFERSLIRERTCAGLAAARAAGKVLGRPSVVLPDETARAVIVSQWALTGKKGGYRALAMALGGCSAMTARKLFQELPQMIVAEEVA
jgi:DNA invertase Pin-like site-specific DNA recombinase